MKPTNTLYMSLAIALLLTGFILGWIIKTTTTPNPCSRLISIHDTLKSKTITYKTIPGPAINVDSLIVVINTFWKDSLKTLYGKGLFEAKFQNENKLGHQEFTLESRIPIDPEANLILDEQLTLPPVYTKRTFGIYAGLILTKNITIAATLGLKYYLLDYKHFSLTASADYTIPLNKGNCSSEIPLNKGGKGGCYLNITSEASF